MRSLLLIALCTFSYTVVGECVRYEPPPKGTVQGYTDGPGSWGELQDTVTLECLRYVGSIEQDGKEYVLIQDERGKIHRLRVGDFMGERTGMIVKIDAETIYIEQIVYRNGAWQPVIVKFPKNTRPIGDDQA